MKQQQQLTLLPNDPDVARLMQTTVQLLLNRQSLPASEPLANAKGQRVRVRLKVDRVRKVRRVGRAADNARGGKLLLRLCLTRRHGDRKPSTHAFNA